MPLFCSHIYFGWPVAGATSPFGNIACSAPVSDRSSLRTRVFALWASSFAANHDLVVGNFGGRGCINPDK
jgi:hypothetical protein